MVCLRRTAQNNEAEKSKTETLNVASNKEKTMDFGANDDLEFQLLAGGNITGKPPLFDASGEYLFVMCHDVIQVFSIKTGELARKLTGATEKLVSMQLELREPNILVACTETSEVLRWSWSIGILEDKIKLDIPAGDVLTFDLINLYSNTDRACAFVIIRAPNGKFFWFVVNTNNGCNLTVPLKLSLDFKKSNPLVAVGAENFKYIIIALNHIVFFIDYTNWRWVYLKNAQRVPITVVRFHPKEEMVATGDKDGKVFLWREFMKGIKGVKTTLYHWHHNSVTSIAFSATGISFFSGGLESVLCKWDIKTHDKMFVPRMSAIICHIAVSIKNMVAVSTADNSLYIIGNDNKLQNNLQKFTYVVDDETGKSKFPIGLRLNPRTNTLVLNGRMGQLQFYSAYTKSLLYNLDIVNQNRLSLEKGKILYNIRVEKAAFNIDWMATGEVFNDEQHFVELRLKFWKYRADLQNYVLNTNIELPHEGGFRAIEFSNDYQVNNLYCATVGHDNIIKIWTEEDAYSLNIKEKVWSCIAQTQYKNLPIESICFSQDGSLLAAGCGKTLCIYQSDNLHLKAALTGTGGVDGCISKAQVRLPKQKINGSKNEILEEHRKLLQLFTNLLEANEETLIKEIKSKIQLSGKLKKPVKPFVINKIENQQKQQLYNKIMQMHELNLYQKLLLFQKLEINCRVDNKYQTKMIDYLRKTVDYAKMRQKARKLESHVLRIGLRERFKAKYRLQQYIRRRTNYDAEITNNLVPIMSVLNLQENVKTSTAATNKDSSNKHIILNDEVENTKTVTNKLFPPVQTIAQILHVQFAAGEYAHLVVVCTETRVMVWNLLTLRLQSVLRLSVQHLAFDKHTNLMAALTKSNELHVFQANVPLPIYQRKNLPHIDGAVWLPRRQPNQRSINIDWQAHSTLYFLTKNQDILFLNAPNETAPDGPPPITFNEAASATALQYSTFGTYAIKQHSDKQTKVPVQLGPVVLTNTGKTAVKSLIEMSTHTTPPLSLLGDDFIKSLVKPADSSSSTINKIAEETEKTKQTNSKKSTSNQMLNDGFWRVSNGVLHSNDEDDDENMADESETKAAVIRKTILGLTEEIHDNYKRQLSENVAPVDLETKLKNVAAHEINVDF